MATLSPASSRSSSPLSSLPSQAPPTPPYYLPSPASQDLSDTSLPTLELDSSICQVAHPDGAPPAKRRRTMEPKPRFTRHLDLEQAPSVDSELGDVCVTGQQEAMDMLLKVLHKRRKIVVVAGAGISVSAGIPDFRSRTGLFSTTHKQAAIKATGKHLFDASVYKTDAATSQFHDMVRSLAHLVESSKPTPFHQLLARLAEEGRLMRLYTQNVDGLEVALQPLATNVPLNGKGPWPRTIQLHGGLGKMVCQKCHHLSDFQASLFEGPDPPPCQECKEIDSVRTNIAGKRSHGVGRLRPRIVLYNEHNPDEDAIGAVTRCDLRSRPDALIVVGTSLKVRGVRRIVKEMCGVVRGRRDGVTVWINNGPPPVGKEFEDCWDLVVKSDSDVVANLADNGRPGSSEGPAGEEIDEQQWAAMKHRGEPKVILKSPKKIKSEETAQMVLAPVGNPTAKLKLVLTPKAGDEPSKTTLKMPPKAARGAKKPLATTGTKSKKTAAPSKQPASKAKAKKKAEVKGMQKISGVFKASKAGATAAAPKSKAKPGSKLDAKQPETGPKPQGLKLKLKLPSGDATRGTKTAPAASRKRSFDAVAETPSPSPEQPTSGGRSQPVLSSSSVPK